MLSSKWSSAAAVGRTFADGKLTAVSTHDLIGSHMTQLNLWTKGKAPCSTSEEHSESAVQVLL